MSLRKCTMLFLIAMSTAFAQNTLTNESILKLVKAGMDDEIIIGVIHSQAGEYVLGPDALLALQQAGVSQKIIAVMVNHRDGASDLVPERVPAPSLVLRDGTPIRLRLTRTLSSADATTGEKVDFEVLDDIRVGNQIVIPRGTKAIGAVTEAEHKKRMARGGKLKVALEYVRLSDDTKVTLRATKELAGGGHAGAMTAGMVATSLVVWPAAPLFLMMHGKDAVIPQETEITAYTNGDVQINANSILARSELR